MKRKGEKIRSEVGEAAKRERAAEREIHSLADFFLFVAVVLRVVQIAAAYALLLPVHPVSRFQNTE